MSPSSFVNALAAITSINVFNPYADKCEVHDLANAARTRRRNLNSYLDAVKASGSDTIWMGRDLGYRGGRRTGIALTDEHHLAELNEIYSGCIASRATKGPAVAERTAAEIWAALRSVDVPPLLWNVFPLHPHEPGEQLSNRRFTAGELESIRDLNATLISSFGIRRIVAIGQDAVKYSATFGVDIVAIRHPSYGGVSEFRSGIGKLYGLPPNYFLRSNDHQASMF